MALKDKKGIKMGLKNLDEHITGNYGENQFIFEKESEDDINGNRMGRKRRDTKQRIKSN